MNTLTICIPTYNRDTFLDECLASLCPQLIEGVELIVLDNASPDDTPAIVRKWQGLTPAGVGYERHPENIGGNPNLDAAARRGKGRYVWVLGDDEIVLAGAVKRILLLIAEGADFVVLNHTIHDLKMEKQLGPSWFVLTEDRVLKSREETMAMLGPIPGFISAIIARREILTSLNAEQTAHYAAFGFNQLFAFYKGLPVGVQGRVTSSVLIKVRAGNAGLYNWDDFFVVGLGVIFSDLRRDYNYSSGSVRRALAETIMRYQVGRVLDLKQEGRATAFMARRGFPYYKSCWQYWLFLLPLVLLPQAVIKMLRAFRLFLKNAVRPGGFSTG
ncbi:MAG TPA: glycosyltransferase family 2 protein [Rariglobus sp.]|nr:glycosyltransferase family 2 protein [Rariglobus sp.]